MWYPSKNDKSREQGMNIDNSKLLTLFSNLAIFAGLLFLGLEIQQNSLTTAANLQQEAVSYARDHEELLLSDENPVLTELVFRGIRDPDSLSEQELEKFIAFISYRMAVWEFTYIYHSEGLLTDRVWNSWDAWNIELVKQGPGYRKWWDSARYGYDQEFSRHVEEVFTREGL
jgi:hypothetical protein